MEFDCTKQPGAVSNADSSRLIVPGAEGLSPSKHSGMEPLIFAVALTCNFVPERYLN